MFRKIADALRPSPDKWFDFNDIKLIGGALLALVGGWAIVSWLIIVL